MTGQHKKTKTGSHLLLESVEDGFNHGGNAQIAKQVNIRFRSYMSRSNLLMYSLQSRSC